MTRFGRAVVLAGLAAGLLAPAAMAADASEAPGQARHDGDKAETAAKKKTDVDADPRSGFASEDCVSVHVAGRSGRIQIRGGGVHLVVRAEDVTGLEASDLEKLADSVADATCGNAPADKELADAVSAAEKMDGAEVVHENSYGSED